MLLQGDLVSLSTTLIHELDVRILCAFLRLRCVVSSLIFLLPVDVDPGPVSVPEARTTPCISQSNPIGSKEAIRCSLSFAVPNLRTHLRARFTLHCNKNHTSSRMTNDRVFLYTPLKHRLYRGKLLHACGRYRPESVQEAGTTLFISQSNPIASQGRSSFTELYSCKVLYLFYLAVLPLDTLL